MLIVHHSPTLAPDAAPAIPVFSFDDAGIRLAIYRFASDWGDAQAAESYHAGLIVDAGELDGQGAIEAQAVLTRGDARTDDAPAFVRAFAGAWADGYAARIAFAFTHGY